MIIHRDNNIGLLYKQSSHQTSAVESCRNLLGSAGRFQRDLFLLRFSTCFSSLRRWPRVDYRRSFCGVSFYWLFRQSSLFVLCYFLLKLFSYQVWLLLHDCYLWCKAFIVSICTYPPWQTMDGSSSISATSWPPMFIRHGFPRYDGLFQGHVLQGCCLQHLICSFHWSCINYGCLASSF